jgi:phage terminase large subunit GpA-like protein
MKERFVPMVMATPALRERVRLGRSTESTLRYKSFPGGFLFAPSAQSATELASRSAPFVELDEVDRYETIPGEGNPAEIVMLRMGAADIGCAALTSTPRDAETTIIWPYLEGGTYELYHVPCPHCGELQPLIWKGLRWEKGAPNTAHYVCGTGLPRRDDGTTGGCGAVIEEHYKRWMLAEENGARWVAQFPDAPYPSSHLNGLYSPFAKSNWAALVQQWERAQGKPADLQVFVNTRLAELWRETADVVEGNTLLERRGANGEPDLPGLVPNGVGILTAGADVQHNRIEVYVWGWGAGLESWLISSEILLGDPEREADQPGSVWAALDAVLLRKYEHVAGATVPISAVLIDSGHATSQVYAFTRRRKMRKVFAAKGIGGPGIPILGKVSLQTRERVPLWPIGVDSAKTEFLRSQLMEPTPGPGYVHLPEWVTPDQCEQFVAEKRTRRVTRKGLIYEWRKKKEDAANEALDCRNYARAALSLLGQATIARLGEIAEKLSAPVVSKPAPKSSEVPSLLASPKPQRARGGWVDGWRK